jgi:hypothetical protein
MYDERVEQYVEPKEEPTTRMLRQMVVQNKQVTDSGHRRHTDAIKLLVERVMIAEAKVGPLSERLTIVEEALKRPVEATAVRFTPALVLSLLALCASIVGGQRWSTSGIEEKMSVQASRIEVIDTKMDGVKQHEVDTVKLQDERGRNMQMELLRIGNQVSAVDAKVNNLITKGK